MKTNIFTHLSVVSIQIEDYEKTAQLEVNYIEDKILIQSILEIGLTDLNQLLALFNRNGISLSLSDDFDSYHTDKGNIYTLNFKEKGWDEVSLDSYIVREKYKQIRA